MILYATPLTYERLHIKPSETLHYATEEYYPQYDYINSVKTLEYWSEVFEWYVELFYFGGKKHLRTVHLSTGFTLYFTDVDESFMPGLGFRIRNELYKYYFTDESMTYSLNRLYSESFLNFYSRIKDKSRLKSHKIKETAFDADNPMFSSSITGGCIDTVSLNKSVNSNCDSENRISRSDMLKKLVTSIFNSDYDTPYSIKLKPNIIMSQHELCVYSES